MFSHCVFQVDSIYDVQEVFGGGIFVVKIIWQYFSWGRGYRISREFCEDLGVVPYFFPLVAVYRCFYLCWGHLVQVIVVVEAMG